MMVSKTPELRVAWVSTYPPRACGIGTFTRDLVNGVGTLDPPVASVVAAINGNGEQYDYEPFVRVQMEEGNPESYIQAAQRLNRMKHLDIVCLQHDFGKYGLWRDGFEADYLVPMLKALEVPVVVTLHSVTPHPNDLMRETMQGIARYAQAVIVMANIAKVLLQEDYGLDADALDKVVQIPHGVPACAGSRNPPSLAAAKKALGLSGHRVLSTFGLINEGKGIEYVIEAMPTLVEKYPNLLYLVIGETHPEVRKLRGEGYRNDLLARCRTLGLRDHVRFVNRYLSQNELVRYLAATDVYVTPYLARYQITSGTLAYALGCGKAIVSTPYLYAAEALAEGRGILAEFRSGESIANAVDQLLGNPDLRRHVETQAALYGKEMAWCAVAGRYRDLFSQILGRGQPQEEEAAHSYASFAPAAVEEEVPELVLVG
ncbi:MAG TPA: glycosyltransferase family 4 protein [Chloroflexota bacterium]